MIVIDAGEIGGGETGRTTAHLASALDTRYTEIEQLHGERGAQLAAESHTAAIAEIERIVQEEGIACEFERLDGYLFGAMPDAELDAAHRAGLTGVERLERAPLAFFDSGACLRFPNQGQIDPLQYLNGLADALERRGGRIYTHTEATEIGAYVRTQHGTITAAAIVVATNTPVNDIVTMHTKQAAYRTYVIGMWVPEGAIAPGLYWDTADPLHYVRLAGDLLIVGGEDHKTGQGGEAVDRFGLLADWTRQHFPMAGEIVYSWSGQIMQSMDGLAYIGKNPGDAANVYIVTGDSGNGMTHGTIAGMLLTDLIRGRENPWAALYDPARITLRAAGEFARQNVNVAAQYAAVFTAGNVAAESKIPAGCGAIQRKGLAKIAVYRDEDGRLHEFSASCPHLGCIVAWNGTEKTWDCPCHGSRFTALGEVVNGPAVNRLATYYAAPS